MGSIDAPMGGRRTRRRPPARRAGILKYTESQTIAIERLLPVGAPPWIRADRYARVMTAGLKALRRVPGVK